MPRHALASPGVFEVFEREVRDPIKTYDAATATGTVQIGTRKLVTFRVTCFDSGRRVRPPQEGEPVQVVFVEGSSAPLAVVSASAEARAK